MRIWPILLCVLGTFLTAITGRAGGSGLNVIVVENQNSTNSIQLGNAYCELRGVPPENVLRLTNTWSGGNISCSVTEFQNNLLNPLLAMIQDRKLTNQIDYVVLCMDLPYEVIGNGLNSITSALFYGFKPDAQSPVPIVTSSCTLPDYSSNSYAFSELPFREAPPNTAVTNSFLAVMLTASNLVDAKAILSHGVAGDETYPSPPVFLEKSSDTARNQRYVEFDNAIFDTRLAGGYAMFYTNSDFTGQTNILGLQTGLATLAMAANGFVPGGFGDSLTSFAGMLFVNSGQTPLLTFLAAGATGSYGTVTEPCVYLEKFPNPLAYFYQRRGFSLAECYYQSLLNPYQGLIVGEPLSAPFARRGGAVWTQWPSNNVPTLAGQTNLELQFNAATNLPLSQVDLFVDGVWYDTATNLPPTPGDQLGILLNGTVINYPVPTNATISSVAAGLVAAINANSNSTSITASLGGGRTRQVDKLDGAFEPMYTATNTSGDRVELHGTNPALAATNLSVSLLPTTNTVTPTTYLLPGGTGFLDSMASGFHYMYVTNAPMVGDWLQLTIQKTNGQTVVLSVTNATPGATPGDLVTQLINEMANSPVLSGNDGVYTSSYNNYYTWNQAYAVDFLLFSYSPGWAASQIEATLTCSSNLMVIPSGTSPLQDNVFDLQPRNFFYVAAGAYSLPVNYTLDTTKLSDGFHRLTWVAYEGTSVRTQTKISREVLVQNTALQASFNTLYGGTNTDLNATILFSITANTNDISSIQLFGTGGRLGEATNQASALLSVPAAYLGLGLHAFYAIVTDNNGAQYRTATQWIRVVGVEPPFSLQATAEPVTISWPATAGRSYDVLATTNLIAPFQFLTTVTPSNSLGLWMETNAFSQAMYYTIQTSY